MTDGLLYHERVSSNRTTALFLALMLLFLLLFAWRASDGRPDALGWFFLCFSGFFLFYTVNYRTLVIRLTPESLKLTFGILTWRVPLDNVAECRLDELPLFVRMAGAGIHFINVRQRYRASFNFLEYPRVVIAFKRKAGPVRDISFSTRRPDDVLRHVREAVTAIRGDQSEHPAGSRSDPAVGEGLPGGRSISDLMHQIVEQHPAERRRQAKQTTVLQAIERLTQIRARLQEERGMVQTDPLAEVRAECDQDVERTWHGEPPEGPRWPGGAKRRSTSS